jgi:hypothetical protein
MSDSNGIAGWKSRRRRANVEGGRMHRHVIKVTPEEEARLVRIAERHRVTVARLLVESALSEGGETPSERRNQFLELSNLARLVGTVANNINQIARQANSTSEIPADAATAIAGAKSVIHRVDRFLAGMVGR